mmetsp:Transcript_21328/g.40077  ORF Transcript_21328/g.40077 Transcript_21328/m.40077 type:complete len:517 (+) Transcript_21328:975-2525(+)
MSTATNLQGPVMSNQELLAEWNLKIAPLDAMHNQLKDEYRKTNGPDQRLNNETYRTSVPYAKKELKKAKEEGDEETAAIWDEEVKERTNKQTALMKRREELRAEKLSDGDRPVKLRNWLQVLLRMLKEQRRTFDNKNPLDQKKVDLMRERVVEAFSDLHFLEAIHMAKTDETVAQVSNQLATFTEETVEKMRVMEGNIAALQEGQEIHERRLVVVEKGGQENGARLTKVEKEYQDLSKSLEASQQQNAVMQELILKKFETDSVAQNVAILSNKDQILMNAESTAQALADAEKKSMAMMFGFANRLSSHDMRLNSALSGIETAEAAKKATEPGNATIGLGADPAQEQQQQQLEQLKQQQQQQQQLAELKQKSDMNDENIQATHEYWKYNVDKLTTKVESIQESVDDLIAVAGSDSGNDEEVPVDLESDKQLSPILEHTEGLADEQGSLDGLSSAGGTPRNNSDDSEEEEDPKFNFLDSSFESLISTSSDVPQAGTVEGDQKMPAIGRPRRILGDVNM